MKAVDRLVQEHDLIERVLNLLERAVARLDAGDVVSDEFLRWVPDFFRQFADQCHHAKEEDVFFPLLKERGIPEEGGPLGVMLHEHVLGRDCVARMRDASAGPACDVAQFSQAARQYLPLLRMHIYKENNVLFRMAERVLSAADDAAAANRFLEVEQARGMSDWQSKFAEQVAHWEEQLS